MYRPDQPSLSHPQRGLGVLADAPLVPAADRGQRAAAEQPHRADERHRVALVARRHVGQVERLVGVDAGGVVGAALEVAIALEGLQEADGGVGEVGHGLAQVVRLHEVVGVDQADDLRTRIGVLAQRQVARARLVTRPGIDVHELHPRPITAVLLHRPPHRRVLRVVVDHDDLEIRIVDPLRRLDRLDQQLRRLVVSRDVQRHHRQIARIRLRQRTPPPRAGQHVARVVDVGEPHHRRGHVEQEHEGSRDRLEDRARGDRR